jgi:hypothetical protein
VGALRQPVQQQTQRARKNQPYVIADILMQYIRICMSKGVLARLNISKHYTGRGGGTTKCFIPNQLLANSG